MTRKTVTIVFSVLLAVLCATAVSAASNDELYSAEEFAFKEGYDPLYNQMKAATIKTQSELFEREKLNLQNADRILKEVNTPVTTIKSGAVHANTATPARLNGLAQPESGAVYAERGNSAGKSGATTMQRGTSFTSSGTSSTAAGKVTAASGAGSTVSGATTTQSGAGTVASGRANSLPSGTSDTTASGDAVLVSGNVSLPSARQLARDEVIARLSQKMNQVRQASNATNNAVGAKQSTSYENTLNYIKAMKEQTEKNYPNQQQAGMVNVPHSDSAFYKKVISVLRNNH